MTPKHLLTLEGAAVFAASIIAYHLLHASWALFALLVLTPDIFMLGYLVNTRIGAAAYNLVHTYTLPLALGVALVLTGHQSLLWLDVIWFTHLGWDRMLGYGLKYETAFKDTHLQRV